MAKSINRSAKTGRIVSEKFADKHPATTVKETVNKRNVNYDLAWLKQSESWKKGQVHSIHSRRNEIWFLQEDIVIKKRIIAELKNEISLMQKTLAFTRQQENEVKRRIKK